MLKLAGKIPDSERCRLCTANDMDAVIERLACDLWESRRGGTFDDWPWAETSEFWKRTFRDFARTAVESLHPGRGQAASRLEHIP